VPLCGASWKPALQWIPSMFSTCSKAVILCILAAVAGRASTVRSPSKRAGAGSLFQIVRHGKWGFMDRTGRVVIRPKFADERDFFYGLAAVELKSGKWGYIDQAGRLVIDARFDGARDFLEELAPVRIGRKWGYIDTSGRMVIEPQFQAAGEFHEGLARVHIWSKVFCGSEFTNEDAPFYAFHLADDEPPDVRGCYPEGGKFGYIDKTGKMVITPQFFIAQDFSEGLAAVRVEETVDSKFGYVNRSGNLVIGSRFNQAEPFSEGLAAVETSARIVGDRVEDIAYGFIDHTGALRIPDKYDFAGNFSEGLARVAIKAGVSEGYIDHDGKMVIPPEYAQAGNFSEGMATACNGDDSKYDCFYIDRSGSPVLKQFWATWPFTDGLAVIGVNPPQDYIDKKGRFIAQFSNEYICKKPHHAHPSMCRQPPRDRTQP